jgi:hypothetical protein
MSKPKRPKPIPKRDLRSFLKQGKTRKAIAKHYGISESKLDRYIRKYKLVRLVRRGRRPTPRKSEKIRPKRIVTTWILVKSYIGSLDAEYRFVNINYPPARYVNQKTLICSDHKRNPKGRFTTVGIYSIVYVSNVYFLFATSIRYSQQPRPFGEIYGWVSTAAPAILEECYHSAYYVVRIIAYTFSRPKRKPRVVHYA